VFDPFLSILRTAEEVLGNKYHVRQPGRVGDDLADIDHGTDIDAAVADKNADAGGFPGNVPSRRQERFPDPTAPCRGEVPSRPACCRTGLHHRIGNIFRSLKKAAHVDPRTGGRDRARRLSPGEVVDVELDPQPLRQGQRFRPHFHSDGQDHQVETLLDHHPILGDIADDEVAVTGNRVDGVDAGTNKPHAILIAGSQEVFLEVFAVGAHIHEKDGGFNRAAAVLAGTNGLLDGKHAADAGTVAVPTVLDIT